MSLVIKNGMAFLDGRFQKKDILMEDGAIAAIANSLAGDESINAEGMLVLPGLIDPHVHLREPGDTYKEDFTTGGRAAIAGGFTTVIDMPNNRIPTTTRARLEEKQKLAEKKALCDVLFHFGGTDANFDEVRLADPRSLKLYLGRTTGELLLQDPSSLERHFMNFPADRPIVLHACDDAKDEKLNLERTCANVERSVALAQKQGRRIHLAHASSKKEITIAKKYSGCTVEVAPHHLFLNSDDALRLAPLGKVYPPLRSEQKRLMLWSALESVDCIGSDHAPHTIEDKEAGAAGFPGLETSLAVMYDGVNRGLLDRIWLAQRMSERVADIFGIGKKGRLRAGHVADATIFDPRKEWTVDASLMESKCHWTPFDGKELKGRVCTVIKDGEPVYSDYAFLKKRQ